MKRKSIFLILVFGLITINRSQASVERNGYFITKTNDTVNVRFEIPGQAEIDYQFMQWRIKYYDSENKGNILKPDEAKEFVFFEGSKKIRMISCVNDIKLKGTLGDNSSVFLHLIRDGKNLKLFKFYYEKSSSNGIPQPRESYILQKKDQGLFRPTTSFQREMSIYFNDCPDIATKIVDKEYKVDNIKEMIDDYNKNCGK